MTRDLFYEIGTEEVPARFINNAVKDMERLARESLKSLRIDYEHIDVFATPRRFAIHIKNVQEKQADLEEVFKGPAKKIALDQEGNPTKALIGFAKGKGADVANVEFIAINGEEYAHVKSFSEGLETKKYIKEILENIIRNTNFPKPMKWGNKNIKFIRPIRWLVSLFGDEIIEFDIEGIPSSNITKGHRFLGQKEILVKNFYDYQEKLKENFVILDQNLRKELILSQVKEVAKSIGGQAIINEEILDEVNFIVEYPTAFYGTFDKEYLKLPREAIITPMENHQRYFPVIDSNQELMNYFITVRNGNSYMIDNVRKGNQKVLDARLQDAKFFFNDDIKKPLADYLPNLATIVFHQKLGTMLDKVNRIKKSSLDVAKILGFTSSYIERTAELAKADLTTQMVFEFGELQGVMGSYYAKLSGEETEVSIGIYEHYLPRNAEDLTPQTQEGIAVSLADKMDTIAGFFSIGITPTGSQDQFALRRQAIGILKTLIERKLSLSLEELTDIGLLTIYGTVDKDIEGNILNFMNLRLKNIMLERGIRYDIVNSLSGKNNIPPYKIIEMGESIEKWLKNDKVAVLTAFQRGWNLVCKIEAADIKPALFEHQSEQALLDKILEVEKENLLALEESSYGAALEVAEKLTDPINDLFDNVMVMHENQDIKNNRLNLIRRAVRNLSDIFLLEEIVY